MEQIDTIKGHTEYSMSGCNFFNNTSAFGGAISAINIENITISNCTFENNSALVDTNKTDKIHNQGFGGGIYLSCSNNKCETIMRDNNVFKYNYAQKAGGGIKWEDIEPIFISKPIYLNNIALIYGNDIGSFSQKLI